MNKFMKWMVVLIAVSLCGATIFGYRWVRQYQALADTEPEIVLSPDVPDLTYCTPESVPLKLDLYFPAEVQPPWQVLVYSHGGSFTSGDKRSGSGIIDIPAMTGRGYAVAAINYRLMPEHPFPAEVIDAKCAIRFLRAHSGEYQLKTEKIGIWGGSAGGHLSAMVGLTNDDPAFETGDYLNQSSRVDAVVDMFGPSDLTARVDWLQRLLLRRAFGTSDRLDPLLRQASPVYTISGDEPPFLFLHGEQDSAVPVEQAQIFHQKLVEVGVNTTLTTVANANHNFKPTGGPIQPTRQEISKIMGDFFDLWLK